MYCSKCGKENPDNAIYCSECGEKIRQILEEKRGKISETEKAGNAVRPKISEKPEAEYYAGFWVRLGAYLVDWGIGSFVFAFLISFILAFLFGSAYGNFIASFSDTLFGIGIFIIYKVVFLALFSTTPGKALYGLKVLRKDTQENVTWDMSVVRPFLQILSALVFGIGYWNMNKNKCQQAWHDKQVNSVVVGKRKNLTVPVIITGLSILAILYFNVLYSNAG